MLSRGCSLEYRYAYNNNQIIFSQHCHGSVSLTEWPSCGARLRTLDTKEIRVFHFVLTEHRLSVIISERFTTIHYTFLH